MRTGGTPVSEETTNWIYWTDINSTIEKLREGIPSNIEMLRTMLDLQPSPKNWLNSILKQPKLDRSISSEIRWTQFLGPFGRVPPIHSPSGETSLNRSLVLQREQLRKIQGRCSSRNAHLAATPRAFRASKRAPELYVFEDVSPLNESFLQEIIELLLFSRLRSIILHGESVMKTP